MLQISLISFEMICSVITADKLDAQMSLVFPLQWYIGTGRVSIHWREERWDNLSMQIFRERIYLKEFFWGKLIRSEGDSQGGGFSWYHEIYTRISSLGGKIWPIKICNVNGTNVHKIYIIKSSLGGQSIYYKQYLRWTKHVPA